MSADWPLVKLSEFINIKHGFAFKGEFFVDKPSENLLVTPGNFAIGGGFKSEKFKYYDGPIPQEYIFSENDLVVTMTDLSKEADTLGYSALIPTIKGRILLHNQRVGLVQFKNQELNKTFLYFLLRSAEYRHHVVSTATGSTVKHTSPSKILDYEFRKPPLDIQIDIGRKLISFERKAVLNTQTNQTLESIAQAFFKSWFVDFEPVKAKIAALAEGGTREQAELAAMGAISGKSEAELAQLQQQNPEHYQQLAETAALFPSAMVESELGEIPEGWEVCAFQEIASVIMGQSPAGDTYNSEANGMPLINGPVEFGDYYPEKSKWTTSPTKLAAKGDLVVCVRGSTTGRFIKSDDQYCLGRGVCAIRGKKYQCFSDLFFKHNIEPLLKLATGSTFPNWSSQTLNSFLVISPIDPLLIIFEEQIKALIIKLENGVVENSYLSQLRDSLLPKLLSGEIDLSDIQSEVA